MTAATTTAPSDTDAEAGLRQGRNGNPFGKMFLWLALHPEVDAPAAAMHGLLCSLSREDGETAMPSMEQIGQAFNIKSRATVRKYLQQLRAAGGLDYHQHRTADNWKTRNIYTVHFDPPEDFDGFRTWKRWREHHFPKIATKDEPAGGRDGQKTTHGRADSDASMSQISAHSNRTHREELSSEGVCVDGSAETETQPPDEPDPMVAIRAVVRGVYGEAQRAKITKPEHRAQIRALIQGLLDRGWTVDALVRQLRQRVTWNSRTVAFGKNLISALTDIGPLAVNSALVDEWADPDDSSFTADSDARGGANTSNPVRDDPHFGAFWAAYPRRRDKQAAWDKWTQLIREGADPELIIAGAARYRAEREGEDQKYTKLAKTWLHNRCWENSPELHRPVPAVREPLSDRRRREAEEALAAYEADLAAATAETEPSWTGTVIDVDGRPG